MPVLLHPHDPPVADLQRIGLSHLDGDSAAPSAHPGAPRHDHPFITLDEVLELHDLGEAVLPELVQTCGELPHFGDPAIGALIRLVRSGTPLRGRVVCGERGVEVAAGECLEAAAHDLDGVPGHSP